MNKPVHELVYLLFYNLFMPDSRRIVLAALSGCSLVSRTKQMKIHLLQDSRFRPTSILTIMLIVMFKQVNGLATVKPSTLSLRRMKGGELWFPEKSRLLVEVELTDDVTGEIETAVDSSCQFTSSPYMIEFKNTAKYFKPGLRFVVKVQYSLEGILASQRLLEYCSF